MALRVTCLALLMTGGATSHVSRLAVDRWRHVSRETAVTLGLKLDGYYSVKRDRLNKVQQECVAIEHRRHFRLYPKRFKTGKDLSNITASTCICM